MLIPVYTWLTIFIYCTSRIIHGNLSFMFSAITVIITIMTFNIVLNIHFLFILYFYVKNYLLMSFNMIFLWLWSILVHFWDICHGPVKFPTQIDWHIPLLFDNGHTLILAISNQFNSLQLHKIRWKCPRTWCRYDYCPFLHKFFTNHDNFAKILIGGFT